LQISADFQKAISHCVWANNLAPDMLEIARVFSHLNMASIVIPTIIQAMILLNAMPKEFDSIRATMLQKKTTAKITFAAVQEAVMAEHAPLCSPHGRKIIPHFIHLNNVK